MTVPTTYCEACGAPLFEDDDYIVDEGGTTVCKPALDLEGPCYSDRAKQEPSA